MTKACSVCGAPAAGTSTRCGAHPKLRRDQALNRRVAASGVTCWRCGGGPRVGDPFTAGHVVGLAQGGTNDASNLLPEHESCNKRAGAAVTNGG